MAMRAAVTTGAMRGFTLIENMVALAIFAIGVLAIAYLLMDSMGLARNSRGLTGATIAAEDMAGMIRADDAHALAYNGISTPGAAGSGGAGSMEALNVAHWEQILAQLPGSAAASPAGQVQVAPAIANTVTCPCQATISVSWGHNDHYVLQTMVGY